MKSRVLILISLLSISCINTKIKNNNKTYDKWEKNIFYPNRYEIVVSSIFNVGNGGKNYDYYIGGNFLSNQDSIIISNLYLKDTLEIKEGDTLIKPHNNYNFYIKRTNKTLKYKWSWDKYRSYSLLNDEKRIEKGIRKGFRNWEKNTFFAENYIAVVDSFEYTKWEKYIPNRKYINASFLTQNAEYIHFDKMILKEIDIIKKGDTLTKSSNSKDLHLIKNGQKIKLNYQWRWNMKEKIL